MKRLFEGSEVPQHAEAILFAWDPFCGVWGNHGPSLRPHRSPHRSMKRSERDHGIKSEPQRSESAMHGQFTAERETCRKRPEMSLQGNGETLMHPGKAASRAGDHRQGER